MDQNHLSPALAFGSIGCENQSHLLSARQQMVVPSVFPGPDRPNAWVRKVINMRERLMSTTIEATYDGQVFRPASLVLLEPNTSVRLTIEAVGPGVAKPTAKDYPEADFYMPVEYNWADSAYEVEQALVSYSGRTYADY